MPVLTEVHWHQIRAILIGVIIVMVTNAIVLSFGLATMVHFKTQAHENHDILCDQMLILAHSPNSSQETVRRASNSFKINCENK